MTSAECTVDLELDGVQLLEHFGVERQSVWGAAPDLEPSDLCPGVFEELQNRSGGFHSRRLVGEPCIDLRERGSKSRHLRATARVTAPCLELLEGSVCGTERIVCCG